MLLERYEYEIVSPFQQYDFYSEGAKRKIRKAVLYRFLEPLMGWIPLLNLPIPSSNS